MVVALVANALLNVTTVVLFTVAGVLVSKRASATPRETRLAMRMFAAWWFAVACVMLLAGAPTLLAAVGVESAPLAVAMSYVTALPLAIALWSLLYYLVFIYTGRRSALWLLGIAYAAFFLFELYYFSSFGTRTLATTDWSVRLVGTQTPPSWITITFGLLLAVPVLFIVVAYAALYGRATDPAARQRVALVSTAFALWFGVVLVAFLLGWDRADWFPVTYEAPGVLAAALIVTAYRS